jgi:DNA-directed RNA polymerase I subunit RPA1
MGVFGVYGIDVNPRHLSLIADFMTRTGGYHAMNRIGMHENSSPLLQMSFETTCSFLLQAAQEGRHDNQESPTSRIVVGNPPKIGTGCFDLMVPIAE